MIKKLLSFLLVLVFIVPTAMIGNSSSVLAAENEQEYEIIDVSINPFYYSALRSDGTLWCWKSDTDTSVPKQVTGLENVTDIVAGNYAYVLKQDGTVCYWNYVGFSAYAEDGSEIPNYSFTDLELTEVTAISQQDYHLVALKQDGTLWGIGTNTAGELGLNNVGDIVRDSATKITNVSDVKKISTSCNGTLYQKNDGSYYFLGFSLAVDNDEKKGIPFKIELPQDVKDVKEVKTSENNLAFITDNNTVHVYGLYDGRTDSVIKQDSCLDVILENQYVCYLKEDGSVWIHRFYRNEEITKVSGLSNIKAIEHNQKELIAIGKNNKVYTWNYEESTAKEVSFPFKTKNNTADKINTGAIDIAASYNNFSVLSNDGTVWGWRNTDATVVPTAIEGLTNVKEIVSGMNNFALKKDGSVTSWNDYDIVYSYNDKVDRGYVVNDIDGFENIKSLSQDKDLFALKEDGSVWAFGQNNYGELGEKNLNLYVEHPYQIDSLDNIKSVIAGNDITFIIKNDNTVLFLGRNNGQLGDTYNLKSYMTPQPITSLPYTSEIKNIVLGQFCSAYINNDNSTYLLGSYYHSYNHQPKPFEHGDIKDIILANTYMCFVKQDGTVWIHRYDKSKEPIKIDSLSNIKDVENYRDNIIALSENGDVFTLSYNNLTPVKINLPFQPAELNYSNIVKIDMSYEDTDIPGIMQAKVMAHMKDGSVHDVTHDENIIYESQDTTIATVTDQGVIAIFKEEKAHISVTFITEDGSLTFTEEGVEKRFNKSEAVLFTPYKILTQSSQNGNNQESDTTTPTIKIDGKKKKSWLQKIFGGGPKDVDYGDSYVDENGVTHYYHSIFESCYLKYDIINVIPKNTYYRRVYKAPSMPAKALRIRAIYVLEDGTEIELPAEYTEFKTNRDTKSIKYIKNDGNPDSRIIYASNFSQGELKITTKFKFDKGEKAEKGFDTDKLNAELTLQVRPNFIDELLFYNNGLKGKYKAKSVASYDYGADTYVKSLKGSMKGMLYKTFDLVELSSAKQIKGLIKNTNNLSDSQWNDTDEIIEIPEYAIGDSFKDINKKYSLSYMWRTGDADKSTFHVIFGIGESVVYLNVPPKSGNINIHVLKGEWVPAK